MFDPSMAAKAGKVYGAEKLVAAKGTEKLAAKASGFEGHEQASKKLVEQSKTQIQKH